MDATHAVTNMVTLAEVNENKVTPGLLGFVVFAVLALGVWLLMKSMHRHMGRVDFVEEPATAPPAAKRGLAARPNAKADRDAAPKGSADR
ncbi:hypothetical protein [Streptomyces fuscigenes]|uniref:hypothetical protein n=1 Tax=Streptomyces fuscigenes TaxID=1528880 RepID=UPI001F216FA5|nr:hypothetical protein [Streptomyces fuscigenes]MCF3963502.1 hypothetical protein [Streptomyces fuscigenes]